MSAGEDRLGAIARTKIPYVGSVGALEGLLTAAREHHVSVMLLPPARPKAP